MQAETTPEQAHCGMPGQLLAVLAVAESGLGSAPRASSVRGSATQWAQVVQASQRVLNLAAAVQDEAIVALAAIEPELLEDGTVVETHRAPGHVALDAPAIVSGALAVSAVHAERRVRCRGPAGRRRPSRVRHGDRAGRPARRRCAPAVSTRTGPRWSPTSSSWHPPPVAAAVVAALGEHLHTDAAPQLRRRCRTVLSRVSPDLVVQRAKQARERCSLRRWAEEPGVDKWEGTFPSQDAARAWAAIDARAHELVADGTCRADRPRPLPGTDRPGHRFGDHPDHPHPHRPRLTRRASNGGPAGTRRRQRRAPGHPMTSSRSRWAPEGSRCWSPVRSSTSSPRARTPPPSGASATRAVGHCSTTPPRTRYRPPAALAALVRRRDGRCRFPGCHVNARFCDLDHVRPWPNGPTTATNLICLCRRHHRVKQRHRWRVRLHPDATATFTDPTGRARTTHPIDALHTIVLPAPRLPSGEMDTAHADDVADATALVRSATDRFSVAEFALEHALAGSSCAHRLRIDVHHPHAHRPRADQLVLADNWEARPGPPSQPPPQAQPQRTRRRPTLLTRPTASGIVTPCDRRHLGMGGWSHDLAASQHRADRRRSLRRPRRGRRHQRGRLGRGPGGPGCLGGPHRPRRLRRLHQPGVEQPGVGWLQVPRALRAAAGLRPVPQPQPADEGLPRQHQGDLLPRDARPHRALPPVVRSARRDGLLGHRAVRHQAAARLRRRAPGGGRAGHRHEHRRAAPCSTRTATSSTTTPASSSRFVRSAIEAGRRRRQLRRAGLGRAGRRPLGLPAARHRLRRGGHHLGPRGRQRRRPVRRRAQHLVGAEDGPPDRLLQGHPPDRAAAHDDPARPRPRVLRRHPAAVLRHPDGAPVGDRHHRHPHRHPVHPRHRRGPRVPARPDQRPPRPARSRSPPTTSSPSAPACARSWSRPRVATRRTPTGPR